MNAVFSHFAAVCAHATGSPWAFVLSVAIVVVWGATGPAFGYSDTWQLVINTSTTVITFWLVFIIQHTQNRDTKALHAKLDELIHAVDGARDALIKAEEHDEQQLDEERLDPTRGVPYADGSHPDDDGASHA